MQREVESIHTRCQLCGQATWLLIRTTYLNDAGEQTITIMAEPVPHSAKDCTRFQALEKETWPHLWEE